MKKLKTTFTALVLAGSLLVATGVAGAAEPELITPFAVADPGTGGGGK